MTTEREPWEWDGDCTACHAMLDWRGDPPECEADALCHECCEDELRTKLVAMTEQRDALKLDFQAYVAWVGAFEDLLAYSQSSIHDSSQWEQYGCDLQPQWQNLWNARPKTP